MKALVAGLAAMIVAAVIVVVIVVALPRLVEDQLRAALGRNGVANAEFTVETVGWREASVVDVRIGDGLTIAALTARYGLSEIIDGFLRELTVEGLILRGAVSGDGVAFAALDPFLGENSGGDAWVIPVGAIVLRNSRVELSAPLGDMTISVDGLVNVVEQRDLEGLLDITVLAAPAALIGRLTFTASQGEGYDAQLEIIETVLGAAPPLAGEIAARLKDDRLSVDGALYTPDGALALTAGVTVADISQGIAERGFRFDLDAELWLTDPALPNQASLGQGRLSLKLSGTIPTSSNLAELALSGDLDLDLDAVTLPGLGEGLSLFGAMTIETDGGVVTVASEQISIAARHLDLPAPADRLALNLGPWRLELRAGPDGVTIDGAVTGSLELGDESAVNADFAGRLDLDPAGVLRRFDLRRLTSSASDIRFAGNVFNVDGLRLSLAGTPEAFAGNAQAILSSASFAAAGLALIQPTLSLETALAYGGDELSLSLATGTSLDAASLTVTGLAPLVLHVETVGESTVAIARDGRLRLDLRLALPAMKIETPSLAATVTLPALRLRGVLGERYIGSAEISGGAVELPGRDLALDGIDASLDLEAGNLRGDFSVRELSHPAAAPLAANGSFDLAEGVMDFSGRLTDGGALTLNLTGRHALATGTGGVSVEMARLALDPDGTQPGDLAPGLRGLAADVRGTIAAVARFAWDSSSGGDGLTSEATLLVEDLSLDVGGLRFERVNSVIAFDSLWPLSTAPAQQLAVGLIDAGLPLTDGIVDFQLRPDGTLYVESAVWRWAGGRLKTRDVLLDPDAERHSFTLEIEDLDLAEIVALSDMKNLSASGRLSGQAPVTITAEGLAISKGRLETAPGGGLLRYAPDMAPAVLRQGGEGATLALSVLENFRYESLRIDIDRETGGDAEIAVHLRGSNADVYDGYPIEFNLNISGPIDQMLRRGLEGYRVPDAIAERLQVFGGQ